ncbi:MAG: cupin domain-containing protein [Xanthobacteraceae bacterium]
MAVDPLAEIVTLLQPSASFSKLVEYAGRWRIRRDVEGKPIYFAVLEGECRVVCARQPPIIVRAGDFLLSPSTNDQIIESIDAPPRGIAMLPVELGEGRFRVGRSGAPVNLRMQVGLCSFASPDAGLLVSLLPSMVIARGESRLATLMQLVGDETRNARPGET